MEGLCGRACDTCTWRDPLDCPGCQTGPGRPYSGDCSIADCCRKKGHADCSSCTYISCCHLRCQREDMPRRRLRELEERQQRQDWLDRNAPVLAKWLWLLFWLVIPRTLAETLTLDEVASSFPAAGTVGEVLGALDDALPGKWRRLWRWEAGSMLALFGCLLLVLLSAILALLILLAASIGLIVAAVLRLVYLYRTAKLFRQHCPAALPEHLE